jgi:hypothetical protein
MINANRQPSTAHHLELQPLFFWLVVKKRRFMNPVDKELQQKSPVVTGLSIFKRI